MGVYGRFKKTYKKYFRPWRPDLLVPCAAGLVMCYFGGEFSLIISAIEAYRMCGWEESRKSFYSLLVDIDKIIDKSEADDLLDEDNDGIPDVEQISPEELLNRKALLVLQNIDYHRVTDAVNGLNAGFMAAVATLKVRYCKSLTLGSSIGDIVIPALMKTIVPLLSYGIPKQYKPWVPVIVTSAVKFSIVRLAYYEHKVLSAFHCALRGGLLFARGLMDYFAGIKVLRVNHEDTVLDEIMGYALAASGLWFQIKYRFTLPFPLSIVLFPISAVESYLASSIVNDATAATISSVSLFSFLNKPSH